MAHAQKRPLPSSFATQQNKKPRQTSTTYHPTTVKKILELANNPPRHGSFQSSQRKAAQGQRGLKKPKRSLMTDGPPPIRFMRPLESIQPNPAGSSRARQTPTPTSVTPEEGPIMQRILVHSVAPEEASLVQWTLAQKASVDTRLQTLMRAMSSGTATLYELGEFDDAITHARCRCTPTRVPNAFAQLHESQCPLSKPAASASTSATAPISGLVPAAGPAPISEPASVSRPLSVSRTTLVSGPASVSRPAPLSGPATASRPLPQSFNAAPKSRPQTSGSTAPRAQKVVNAGGTTRGSRGGISGFVLSKPPSSLGPAMHDKHLKCKFCGQTYALTHFQRKLFLVAERLMWEESGREYKFPTRGDRLRNEKALASVNAEVSIESAIVETIDLTGDDEEENRQDRDKCYPFADKKALDVVCRIFREADGLSESSWSLWKRLIDGARMFHAETFNDTADSATQNATQARRGMQEISPNVPASNPIHGAEASKGKPHVQPACVSLTAPALETLQDFYKVLDLLKAPSPAAIDVLYAYTVRVRRKVLSCSFCWARSIVRE